MVAVGLLTACSSDNYRGDGFTAFVPTRDLFPEAPANGTDSTMAYLVPGYVENCPPWNNSVDGAVNGEWNGMRYDWTDNGRAASWAISARASGFAEASPTGAQSAFYEANNRCVAALASSPDTSMRWLSLDGLPEGSIAFELTDQSDRVDGRPLHLYGAFVVVGAVDRAIAPDGSAGSDYDTATWAATSTDGPTHALTVAWLAWGTEVPPDQFVATVNALTKAATAT